MKATRGRIQGEYFPGRVGFNSEAYEFQQSLKRMARAQRKRKAAWKAIDFDAIKHKIVGRRAK